VYDVTAHLQHMLDFIQNINYPVLSNRICKLKEGGMFQMTSKEELVDAIIKAKEENISKLEESLKSTRKQAREAEGSNVTHSDTSKFQYSNLALGIEKRLLEANEGLEALNRIRQNIQTRDFVAIGGVVQVMNIASQGNYRYFIVPFGGGDSTEVEGEEITTISTASPM